MNQVMDSLLSYLPNVVAALAILIIGWIAAIVIGGVVRSAVQRTPLDSQLGRWLGGGAGRPASAAVWIGAAAKYLVLLMVLVAFFQALNLSLVTNPLQGLLNQVLGFLPRMFGAVVLLVVAWALATILRLVVQRGLTAVRLDERLSRGMEGSNAVSLTRTLADVVYGVVFLLFLPPVLDALALNGLLEPVNTLLGRVLGFIPNLAAAAVILAVGWFAATLLRRIITNLLAVSGLDDLGNRLGLSTSLGSQRLSGIVGLVVYGLIFIPVIVGALNALQMEALTQPISAMLNRLLAAIPAIFAAAVVVGLAVIIGRMVGSLVSNLLAGIGFDQLPQRLGLARSANGADGMVTREVGSLSRVGGLLVQLSILFFATLEALRLLEFTALAQLVSQFLVLVGQIALGMVILVVGLYLANLVATIIRSSQVMRSDLLSLIARVAVLSLAGAMALRQMGLANEIINLAFGLLLGAVAVATALAFGLGGREEAARLLNEWRQTLRGHRLSAGDD